MTSFKALLTRLIQEDSGQDLIEYALVAALIGLGAIISMKALGTVISTAFSDVGAQLSSAV